MRIANITFHKVAMAAATITAAAGTAVSLGALSACAENIPRTNDEYPSITESSPYFVEAKKQALYWAKQDSDIKHDCLGQPIRLLGNDTTIACNNGKIISIYPTNGTKEEQFPDGRDTTFSLGNL